MAWTMTVKGWKNPGMKGDAMHGGGMKVGEVHRVQRSIALIVVTAIYVGNFAGIFFLPCVMLSRCRDHPAALRKFENQGER
jgi:hypothetical protein